MALLLLEEAWGGTQFVQPRQDVSTSWGDTWLRGFLLREYTLPFLRNKISESRGRAKFPRRACPARNSVHAGSRSCELVVSIVVTLIFLINQ